MSDPTSRGADFESSLKDSDVTVAAFERRSRGPLDAAQHFLHGAPTMVPVIVLLLSVAVFGVVSNNFFSAFNLSLIMQQVAIVGILAAAQSLVILTAGIDLSVAAVMVMISVIMGRLSVEAGLPVPLAILCTRVPAPAQPVLGGAGVIQTIPSLALLAFMIPIPFLGLGTASAVVALFLYAILPIVRMKWAIS